MGDMYLVETNKKLSALVFKSEWPKFRKTKAPMSEIKTQLLSKAAKQLDGYFSGKRKNFELPFELNGTKFQKDVWTALKKIPYGQTFSYQKQATLIGRPKATRAVGRTNGQNPLPIILPCHRVIGKSGKLVGYGGGLSKKEFLLKLENFEQS